MKLYCSGMEEVMLSALATNQPDLLNPARMLFTGPVIAFGLIAVIIFILALWKLFEKAGHPGWASLIPFYNGYIMLKIAGRPGWWLLLFLVPLVNVVINIVVAIDIAKAFGQSGAFGFFLNF